MKSRIPNFGCDITLMEGNRGGPKIDEPKGRRTEKFETYPLPRNIVKFGYVRLKRRGESVNAFLTNFNDVLGQWMFSVHRTFGSSIPLSRSVPRPFGSSIPFPTDISAKGPFCLNQFTKR